MERKLWTLTDEGPQIVSEQEMPYLAALAYRCTERRYCETFRLDRVQENEVSSWPSRLSYVKSDYISLDSLLRVSIVWLMKVQPQHQSVYA